MPHNLSLRKKIDIVIQLRSDSFESQSCFIREAAKLIGTLVSCSPGVDIGRLEGRGACQDGMEPSGIAGLIAKEIAKMWTY